MQLPKRTFKNNDESRPDTVSVVICAYSDEREQDLEGAIESLRKQTVPAGEIVVVIDHNDALLDRLKARHTGPNSNIKLVPNSSTRGLSGARNSGVVAASGEIIAFIDDDALAAPDWLEHLTAGYTPSVMGVGGPVEPFWLSGRPAWFPEEFDWVVGCTFRGMPEDTAYVGKLIGCNMSFRREVFESIGGFRSDIGRIGSKPIAGEETEFSIRLRQRQPDTKLVYEPRAKVKHRVPAARARWSYFRSRAYYEGVSKALVSAMVGTADGLATERTYTTRTLPMGVLRGLRDLVKLDLSGLSRAATIVAGFAITVYGYVQVKLSDRVQIFKSRRRSESLPREEHA